jgi:membrane fusion protein (multidrug efflux system)
VLLATTLCLVFGCGRSSDAKTAEDEPSFPVASPVVADTFVEREYVAEVRAVRYAEVRSRIKGILDTVAVDEGQSVKAGQTMFTIAAQALKQEALVAGAAASSAEAELYAAQLERQNTKLLFDKSVVSSAELALADAKVRTLKAKLDEARAKTGRAQAELGYAEIKAPFDGVVNRLPKKAGSAIAEDELLTTVADNGQVHAYFRVAEKEYLEQAATNREPKEVGFKLADGSTLEASGVIDAVETEFDRDTGNIAFRARFPNPAGKLKHGSSGKVVVKVPLKGALLVPQKSTFDVQGQLFVYALDGANTPKARKIVPRARIGESFVIESGLDKTDRFVREGIQKVKEGQRIHALPAGGNGEGS